MIKSRERDWEILNSTGTKGDSVKEIVLFLADVDQVKLPQFFLLL